MALWSEKSPYIVANRQSMQQNFTAYRKVEVESLRLNKIAVEANNASVQLVVELNLVGQQQGASVTPSQ
jgi:hypothetical protein